MARRGLMIVIEGSDGSGKATQVNLLSERLKAAGYDVAQFDFPRYNRESSHFIKQYLSGAYGPATKISPYTASLFYALDRYEAAAGIKAELKAGKIVIVDRFVGSNMAHQGSKFNDPVEQRGFFVWADNLEYNLLDIPRPDMNIFLRVPAEISSRLMSQKNRDQHESNTDYLRKSVATYDLLCRLFPKDFTAIECTKDNQLMSVALISNLIWEKIKPRLPAEPPHNGHASIVTLGNSGQDTKTDDDKALGNDKLVHKFRNGSLLLKMAVERQVEQVEPSGFTIWSDNGHRFYFPTGLPKKTQDIYKQTMVRLAELHEQMRDQLEKYYEHNLFSEAVRPTPNISSILLPVTPLAALCDFQAAFSPRDIEKAASHLLASDSPELQWSAQQIYLAARQAWPDEFKLSLEAAGNPEPINNIITKIIEDKLSLNTGDRDPSKLLEAIPRQEFDILAESIYPYSSLSLDEISEEVSNWSYQQKFQSFKAAAADSQALARIRYKFDVISDQLALSKAVNKVSLKDIQVQMPSPRFGYDVPPVVELAGIDDLYLDCFDASLELFSELQRADRDDLAIYSTLLGHKIRWQFRTDAKNLSQLLKNDSDELKSLLESIGQKVAEAHPLTWEVLNHPDRSATAPRPKQNRIKPSKRRRPKSKRSTSQTDS